MSAVQSPERRRLHVERARAALRRSPPVRMLAGALVVLAVGTAAWIVLVQSEHVTASSSPPWRPGVVSCRRDTLDHVHHPTRLVLLGRCATASGVVRSVRYRPGDGDWEVALTPDAGYVRFLPAANGRVLTVRVIPTDVHRVTLPAVGQHVDAYGAWVLDKNADRRARIHPSWAIAPHGGAPPPAPSRHGLELSVRAPRSRAIGSLVPIDVRATTRARRGGSREQGGPTLPAARVHIFLEMTAADGRGVEWKTATTNDLGRTRINVVALHVPGDYALTLYADKAGRRAVARTSLKLRRRGRRPS